jgi:hypothetical protein
MGTEKETQRIIVGRDDKIRNAGWSIQEGTIVIEDDNLRVILEVDFRVLSRLIYVLNHQRNRLKKHSSIRRKLGIQR